MEMTQLVLPLRFGKPNMPTAVQIANMRDLCSELLEPMTLALGPFVVTSGFRSPELNKLVGGVTSSAHMYVGRRNAADTDEWQVPRRDVMLWLMGSKLNFDQAIYEERPKADGTRERWIHLSSRGLTGQQRRQLLMSFDGKSYETFNPHDTRAST